MSNGGAPSNDLLMSLHQSMGEAMRDPDLGPEFAKLTRVMREKRFKRGVTEIQEVTVDGRLRFQVDVGDRLGADVYFGSYRELLDIEAFARVIEPADTMIDVGANFGFVSITVADRTSAKARIIAFEPDPKAHEILMANIRLNKLARRIKVLQRCVSNEDGTVKFHSMAESAFSGMADTKRADLRDVVDLPAQRLDSTAAELGIEQIHALKIDVEGFEFAVLEGAAGLLGRSGDPVVMFEVSRKNLGDDRKSRLIDVISRYLTEGWQLWYYAIESDEMVRVGTAQDLVEGDVGNVFMVRGNSKRLDGLRGAYRDIVVTRLLPLALRKWAWGENVSAGAGQSPHALTRLLWNSFLGELTARLQQESARARKEADRLSARLSVLEPSLAHERGQREAIQLRAETAAADAARLMERADVASQETRQVREELERARAACVQLQRDLDQSRERETQLANDCNRLNAEFRRSLDARDAALAASERSHAGVRDEFEHFRAAADQQHMRTAAAHLEERRRLEATLVQEQAASEELRKRIANLQHTEKELHLIINQRDAARIKAEEQVAGLRAATDQEIGHLRRVLGEAAAAKSASDAQVADLRAGLAAAERARSEVETQLATELEARRRETETFSQERAGLRDENERMAAEIAAARAGFEEAERRAADMAERERMRGETLVAELRSELHAARAQATDEAARHRSAADLQRKELETARQQAVDLEARRKETEAKLSDLQHEFRELGIIADRREAARQELENGLRAKESEVASLREALSRALEDIARHQAAAEAAGRREEELRAALETTQAGLDDTRRQLDATLGRKLRRLISRDS